MISPEQLHVIPITLFIVACSIFIVLIVIRVYEMEKARVKVKTND